VPKLKGKTLRKAKRLLKHAHCRLGKVARKPSTKVKPGGSSRPFKAGTRHRAGTRVACRWRLPARRGSRRAPPIRRIPTQIRLAST
jgi:hypothetical protein